MPVVDHDEYVELLEDAGLGHRVDALVAAMLPSVRLVPSAWEPDTDTPVSRISGPPDLPADMAWPTNPAGTHLAFVAQIDLAAMPTGVTAGVLPAAGWLHAFYDTDTNPWGMHPTDRGGWALTYTAPGTPLTRRPPPDTHTHTYTSDTPAALEPRIETTAADLFTAIRTAIPQSEQQQYIDAMFDLEMDLNDLDEPLHRLLGHYDPIQGSDPTMQAQLASNGLDTTGNPKADPRYPDLAHGATDWRLVLQIDSDHTTGVSFGDSGRISYWMRTDDLAQGNWDTAWLTLECY